MPSSSASTTSTKKWYAHLSPTHLPTHLFIYPLIHPPGHLSLNSFIHSSIHPSTYSFHNSFHHSSNIYLFTRATVLIDALSKEQDPHKSPSPPPIYDKPPTTHPPPHPPTYLPTKPATVLIDALAKEQDPNKSPSPPPIYDSHGKRQNTREVSS